MPIVLAIEPDRRQAAHLKAIVGHQVGAELLIADTTEGALDAIGNRVPDLVLVPALLSPQDDAALAAALRVIAAAAHVRTLTIPALSNGTKRAASGGMLAKWRRARSASQEPDGCDPAVFGEQISAYLAEAAAERAQLEEESIEYFAPAPTPAPTPPPAPEPAPVAPVAIAAEAVAEIEPVFAQEVAFAPPEPETSSVGEPPDASPEDDPDQGPLIDLSDELAELGEEAEDDDLFDGERVGVYTISAETDAPTFDAFDLLPAILEPAAIAAQSAAPEPADTVETPAALRELFAETAESFGEHAQPLSEQPEPFLEQPEPPRADIEPWVPMYLTPGRIWPALEGMPAETPAPRTEQPNWIELVASLRQDLERRRVDAGMAAADPIVARPSDGGEAETRRLLRKPRPQSRRAKPVQDEWGFFDPEQCGFSTLLAKLEEITEAV